MIKTIFAANTLDGSSLPHVQANDALANGLRIFFVIIGAIAFLMMVIAGLNFVLSQGNAEKAAKARNTIIYAGVGLVIAASASLIVTVVLDKAG